MSTQITILGVGKIAAAMAKTMLAADTSITIWNRTPDRAHIKELVELGAYLETDIAAAISKSDIILIGILNYGDIKTMLEPALSAGVLKGKTIVNVVTGTPRDARDMEAFLKSSGGIGLYFDGALMVTPDTIGTEHSSIFVSGETEAQFQPSYELIKPSGRITYVGQDCGAAALWDIAALTAMYGMFHGILLAMNLLKRQLPDKGETNTPSVATPMEQIVVPLVSFSVPFSTAIAQLLDSENWDENFGNSIKMQADGVDTLIRTFKEENVDPKGLEHISSLLRRGIADKGPNAGIAALGTYLLNK